MLRTLTNLSPFESLRPMIPNIKPKKHTLTENFIINKYIDYKSTSENSILTSSFFLISSRFESSEMSKICP